MRHILTERLEWRPDDLVYFEGEPFTGIAFRMAPEGWTLYEREFRHGVEWGRSREWYGPSQLAGECGYLQGCLHGNYREYHPAGALLQEATYEFGFCLTRRRWDENGRLIEVYSLQETEPEYRHLQRKREGWDGGESGSGNGS